MSAKQKHPYPSQEGAVMLYTLLILTVMITIGFVLASIVQREIRLARVFGDSLKSYYAAESGLERSLDIVQEYRKQELLLEDTDAQTRDAISAIENITASDPVALVHSGVEYTIDTTATSGTIDSFVAPMQRDSGIQFELYDPDNLALTQNAQSLTLQWNDGSCINNTLEVTSQSFRLVQGELVYDAPYKGESERVAQYPCLVAPSGSAYTCEQHLNWFTPGNNYIVRIKPLQCDVPQIKATFYEEDFIEPGDGGAVVPLHSVATIQSVGEGRFSQRRMSATTKWIPSASGLIDFVLFSIEKIEKTGE